MILATGEILFDHFPGYRRIGGAPFNFSWHLKKLGYPVRFISRVGDDPEGCELQDLLRVNGFDEKDLQVDLEHPTGAVNVSLDGNGVPTFEILPNAAFDHLELDGSVSSVLEQDPELVYYGTITQRTTKGKRFMEDLFSQAGEQTRFLCDINLRPRCYSLEVVEFSLFHADVLKLNEDELAAVTGPLGVNGSEKNQCRTIMEKYGIGMIALTRGVGGSEIHDEHGSYNTGAITGQTVADTVGAGDAWTSILAIGYLGRWHPERILAAATSFSARICGVEGALPDTDDLYDRFQGLEGD